MRLYAQHGVYQFGISEGELKPHAEVSQFSKTHSSGHDFSTSEEDKGVGIDYFALTYENRSINLDDVLVPTGKVVTGVRFAHRNGHILLEVRGTDFDYEGGRLKNIDASVWYSNEDGGKHEYKIPNQLNPTEEYNDGKVYVPQQIKKNSFVRFGPTDFKADLGRTIVPVIEKDFHGLKIDCPSALSGVGLVYTNDEELTTGGAIATKLIVYELPIPSIDDLLLN